MQQPAVTGVDHDHIEAAGLCRGGRLGKLVCDLIDLFLGHLLDLIAPVVHIAGGADGVFAVDEYRVTERSAVVDLDLGGGAAGVDGIGHLDQIGNGGGVIQTDLHGVAAAGGQIDNDITHADQSYAAGGLQLVVVDIVVAVMLTSAQLGHGGGSREHAVLQPQTGHLQRLEQLFVRCHKNIPFPKGFLLHNYKYSKAKEKSATTKQGERNNLM